MVTIVALKRGGGVLYENHGEGGENMKLLAKR